MIRDPEVVPRIPIADADGKFVATPMELGLRLAGTVELAGLAAPPSWERARILLTHARRMFPALRDRLSGPAAFHVDGASAEHAGFAPGDRCLAPSLGCRLRLRPRTHRHGLLCQDGKSRGRAYQWRAAAHRRFALQPGTFRVGQWSEIGSIAAVHQSGIVTQRRSLEARCPLHFRSELKLRPHRTSRVPCPTRLVNRVLPSPLWFYRCQNFPGMRRRPCRRMTSGRLLRCKHLTHLYLCVITALLFAIAQPSEVASDRPS